MRSRRMFGHHSRPIILLLMLAACGEIQGRDIRQRGGARFTLTPDYDMSSWSYLAQSSSSNDNQSQEDKTHARPRQHYEQERTISQRHNYQPKSLDQQPQPTPPVHETYRLTQRKSIVQTSKDGGSNEPLHATRRDIATNVNSGQNHQTTTRRLTNQEFNQPDLSRRREVSREEHGAGQSNQATPRHSQQPSYQTRQDFTAQNSKDNFGSSHQNLPHQSSLNRDSNSKQDLNRQSSKETLIQSSQRPQSQASYQSVQASTPRLEHQEFMRQDSNRRGQENLNNPGQHFQQPLNQARRLNQEDVNAQRKEQGQNVQASTRRSINQEFVVQDINLRKDIGRTSKEMPSSYQTKRIINHDTVPEDLNLRRDSNRQSKDIRGFSSQESNNQAKTQSQDNTRLRSDYQHQIPSSGESLRTSPHESSSERSKIKQKVNVSDALKTRTSVDDVFKTKDGSQEISRLPNNSRTRTASTESRVHSREKVDTTRDVSSSFGDVRSTNGNFRQGRVLHDSKVEVIDTKVNGRLTNVREHKKIDLDVDTNVPRRKPVNLRSESINGDVVEHRSLDGPKKIDSQVNNFDLRRRDPLTQLKDDKFYQVNEESEDGDFRPQHNLFFDPNQHGTTKKFDGNLSNIKNIKKQESVLKDSVEDTIQRDRSFAETPHTTEALKEIPPESSEIIFTTLAEKQFSTTQKLPHQSSGERYTSTAESSTVPVRTLETRRNVRTRGGGGSSRTNLERNLRENTSTEKNPSDTTTSRRHLRGRQSVSISNNRTPTPVHRSRNIAETLESYDHLANSEIKRRAPLQPSSSRKSETIIVPKRRGYVNSEEQQIQARSSERVIRNRFNVRSRNEDSERLRQESAERISLLPSRYEQDDRNNVRSERRIEGGRQRSRYVPESAAESSEKSETSIRRPERRGPSQSRGSARSSVNKQDLEDTKSKTRDIVPNARGRSRARQPPVEDQKSSPAEVRNTSRERTSRGRNQNNSREVTSTPSATKSRRRQEIREDKSTISDDNNVLPSRSRQTSTRTRSGSSTTSSRERVSNDILTSKELPNVDRHSIREEVTRYTVRSRPVQEKPTSFEDHEPVTRKKVVSERQNTIAKTDFLQSSTVKDQDSSTTLRSNRRGNQNTLSSSTTLTTTNDLIKELSSTTIASTAKTTTAGDASLLTTTAKLERTTRSNPRGGASYTLKSDEAKEKKSENLDEIGENDNYPEAFRQLLLSGKSGTLKPLPIKATTELYIPKSNHLEETHTTTLRPEILNRAKSVTKKPKLPMTSAQYTPRSNSSRILAKLSSRESYESRISSSKETLDTTTQLVPVPKHVVRGYSKARTANGKISFPNLRNSVSPRNQYSVVTSTTTEQGVSREDHTVTEVVISIREQAEGNSGQFTTTAAPFAAKTQTDKSQRRYRPSSSISSTSSSNKKYSRNRSTGSRALQSQKDDKTEDASNNNRRQASINRNKKFEASANPTATATTPASSITGIPSSSTGANVISNRPVKPFLPRPPRLDHRPLPWSSAANQRFNSNYAGQSTSNIAREAPPNYVPTVPTVKTTTAPRPRLLHNTNNKNRLFGQTGKNQKISEDNNQRTTESPAIGLVQDTLAAGQPPQSHLTSSRISVEASSQTVNNNNNAVSLTSPVVSTVSIFSALSEILTQTTTEMTNGKQTTATTSDHNKNTILAKVLSTAATAANLLDLNRTVTSSDANNNNDLYKTPEASTNFSRITNISLSLNELDLSHSSIPISIKPTIVYELSKFDGSTFANNSDSFISQEKTIRTHHGQINLDVNFSLSTYNTTDFPNNSGDTLKSSISQQYIKIDSGQSNTFNNTGITNNSNLPQLNISQGIISEFSKNTENSIFNTTNTKQHTDTVLKHTYYTNNLYSSRSSILNHSVQTDNNDTLTSSISNNSNHIGTTLTNTYEPEFLPNKFGPSETIEKIIIIHPETYSFSDFNMNHGSQKNNNTGQKDGRAIHRNQLEDFATEAPSSASSTSTVYSRDPTATSQYSSSSAPESTTFQSTTTFSSLDRTQSTTSLDLKSTDNKSSSKTSSKINKDEIQILQSTERSQSITTLTSAQQELLDRVAILSKLLSNFRNEKQSSEKINDKVDVSRNTSGNTRLVIPLDVEKSEVQVNNTRDGKSIDTNSKNSNLGSQHKHGISEDKAESTSTETIMTFSTVTSRNRQYLPNLKSINTQSLESSTKPIEISTANSVQTTTSILLKPSVENFETTTKTKVIEHVLTTEKISQVTTSSNVEHSTKNELFISTEDSSQSSEEQTPINIIQKTLDINANYVKTQNFTTNTNSSNSAQQVLSNTSTENIITYKKTTPSDQKHNSKVIIVTPSNLPESTTFFPQHTRTKIGSDRPSPVFRPELDNTQSSTTLNILKHETITTTERHERQNIIEQSREPDSYSFSKTQDLAASSTQNILQQIRLDDLSTTTKGYNKDKYINNNDKVNLKTSTTESNSDVLTTTFKSTTQAVNDENLGDLRKYLTNLLLNNLPSTTSTTEETVSTTDSTKSVENFVQDTNSTDVSENNSVKDKINKEHTQIVSPSSEEIDISTKTIISDTSSSENTNSDKSTTISTSRTEVYHETSQRDGKQISDNSERTINSVQTTTNNSQIQKQSIEHNINEEPEPIINVPTTNQTITNTANLIDTSISQPSDVKEKPGDSENVTKIVDSKLHESTQSEDIILTKYESTTTELLQTTSTTTTSTPVPRARFDHRVTIAPLGTQSSTTVRTPRRDYVIYGILPNKTVVQKEPEENVIPEHDARSFDIGREEEPFVVYAILPNNTIVKKFPNGTVVQHNTNSVRIVDVDPISLIRGITPSAISTKTPDNDVVHGYVMITKAYVQEVVTNKPTATSTSIEPDNHTNRTLVLGGILDKSQLEEDGTTITTKTSVQETNANKPITSTSVGPEVDLDSGKNITVVPGSDLDNHKLEEYLLTTITPVQETNANNPVTSSSNGPEVVSNNQNNNRTADEVLISSTASTPSARNERPLTPADVTTTTTTTTAASTPRTIAAIKIPAEIIKDASSSTTVKQQQKHSVVSETRNSKSLPAPPAATAGEEHNILSLTTVKLPSLNEILGIPDVPTEKPYRYLTLEVDPLTNRVRVSAPTIKDSPSIIHWTGGGGGQISDDESNNEPKPFAKPSDDVDLEPQSTEENQVVSATATTIRTNRIAATNVISSPPRIDLTRQNHAESTTESSKRWELNDEAASTRTTHIQTLTTTKQTVPAGNYIDSQTMRGGDSSIDTKSRTRTTPTTRKPPVVVVTPQQQSPQPPTSTRNAKQLTAEEKQADREEIRLRQRLGLSTLRPAITTSDAEDLAFLNNLRQAVTTTSRPFTALREQNPALADRIVTLATNSKMPQNNNLEKSQPKDSNKNNRGGFTQTPPISSVTAALGLLESLGLQPQFGGRTNQKQNSRNRDRTPTANNNTPPPRTITTNRGRPFQNFFSNEDLEKEYEISIGNNDKTNLNSDSNKNEEVLIGQKQRGKTRHNGAATNSNSRPKIQNIVVDSGEIVTGNSTLHSLQQELDRDSILRANQVRTVSPKSSTTPQPSIDDPLLALLLRSLSNRTTANQIDLGSDNALLERLLKNLGGATTPDKSTTSTTTTTTLRSTTVRKLSNNDALLAELIRSLEKPSTELRHTMREIMQSGGVGDENALIERLLLNLNGRIQNTDTSSTSTRPETTTSRNFDTRNSLEGTDDELIARLLHNLGEPTTQPSATTTTTTTTRRPRTTTRQPITSTTESFVNHEEPSDNELLTQLLQSLGRTTASSSTPTTARPRTTTTTLRPQPRTTTTAAAETEAFDNELLTQLLQSLGRSSTTTTTSTTRKPTTTTTTTRRPTTTTTITTTTRRPPRTTTTYSTNQFARDIEEEDEPSDNELITQLLQSLGRSTTTSRPIRTTATTTTTTARPRPRATRRTTTSTTEEPSDEAILADLLNNLDKQPTTTTTRPQLNIRNNNNNYNQNQNSNQDNNPVLANLLNVLGTRNPTVKPVPQHTTTTTNSPVNQQILTNLLGNLNQNNGQNNSPDEVLLANILNNLGNANPRPQETPRRQPKKQQQMPRTKTVAPPTTNELQILDLLSTIVENTDATSRAVSATTTSTTQRTQNNLQRDTLISRTPQIVQQTRKPEQIAIPQDVPGNYNRQNTNAINEQVYVDVPRNSKDQLARANQNSDLLGLTRSTTTPSSIEDDIRQYNRDIKLLSTLLGRPVDSILQDLPQLNPGQVQQQNTGAGTGSAAIGSAASASSAASSTTLSPDFYGQSNEALLASLLKQQGIGPTGTNSDQLNNLLLQQQQQVLVTPRARPPPPTPRSRPVLDGLSWLWRQWQESAPGVPQPAGTARRPRLQEGSGGGANAIEPVRLRPVFRSPSTLNADEVGGLAGLGSGGQLRPEPLAGGGTEGAAIGGGGLLNAAIGVTRAVSDFLGAAFQGVTQSFQTVFSGSQYR